MSFEIFQFDNLLKGLECSQQLKITLIVTDGKNIIFHLNIIKSGTAN